MKILQVSNLVSHHQIPIAREFVRIVGPSNFRFAATAMPDPERVRMGWNNSVDDEWVLRPSERVGDHVAFESWWDEADIVLCGDRRFVRMGDRLKNGRLCYYTSERWWKPPVGRARLLSPSFFKMALDFRRIANSDLFYYLAIGPYAAQDIQSVASLSDRIKSWGYFTTVPSTVQPLGMRSGTLKVLWAGRMLNWKRVETLVRAYGIARAKFKDISLTLVGDGPEKERLRLLANSLGLENIVFHDSIAAEKVPQMMSDHHVYVLPSSAYEGWGAVVNESMAQGCAFVGTEVTGAAASIVRDGENGLLFSVGNAEELAKCLLRFADNEIYRRKIAVKGRQTVMSWSPSIAAERLIVCTDAVLSGRSWPSYVDGPLRTFSPN